MSVSFLAGEPNSSENATSLAFWKGRTIFTYCSGNNLIIVQYPSVLLQTIYLPCDGVAVVINPETGHLALSLGDVVWILKPTVEYSRKTQWTKIKEINTSAQSLTWCSYTELCGVDDEIALWNVLTDKPDAQPINMWTRSLPQKCSFVSSTAEGQFLAVCTPHDDSIVIVFRRLSSSDVSAAFDYVFAKHPSKVRALHWLQDSSPVKTGLAHLYTQTEDGVVRRWRSLDPHDSLNFQVDAVVDRGQSIMVDSEIVQSSLSEREHPEAIVTLQDNGIDVWAFTNGRGSLAVTSTVVHACSGIFPKERPVKPGSIVAVRGILNHEKGEAVLLIHLQGRVVAFRCDALTRYGTVKPDFPLKLQQLFTGHNKSVQRLIRSARGHLVVSQSRFTENTAWVTQKLEDRTTLRKQSIIDTSTAVLGGVLLGSSDQFFLALEKSCIELFFLLGESKTAKRVAILDITSEDTISTVDCVLEVDRKDQCSCFHVFAVINGGQSRCWQISGDKKAFKAAQDAGESSDSIMSISSVTSTKPSFLNSFYKCVPVYPVSWSAGRKSLSTDQLSAISKTGEFSTWVSEISSDNSTVEWSLLSTVATNVINSPLMSQSSLNKVAIVSEDRLELSIWDTRHGFLEQTKKFDTKICDLDWACTPDNQSVLAIGFGTHVQLWGQLRFDYTNISPCWGLLKQVDIKPFTNHAIGDSIWMNTGVLVVAAGNQLFVDDNCVHEEEAGVRDFSDMLHSSRAFHIHHLFEICSIVNGPLPAYHPQLLVQCILAGQLTVVRDTLYRLYKELQYANQELVQDMDSTLGMDPSDYEDGDKSGSKLLPDEYSNLTEKLQQVSLPFITQHQQVTLASLCEVVAEVAGWSDIMAIRFYLGYKLYRMHRKTQKQMTVRDFCWALNSESQAMLLEQIDGPKLVWPDAQAAGVGYWLEHHKLVELFDVLAKNQFMATERQDPSEASLFYLALRKKQVLQALWRSASTHPEQTKMVKFLKNDFSEPRWRTAALKNAFALLSKHRYAYAASFFLLGDSLKDCVNVITRKLNDTGLAIAVCRVYEGDNGPVLNELIKNEILPEALKMGDQWVIYWCLWSQDRRGDAVRSLVSHEYQDKKRGSAHIVSNSRSFLSNDPALLILYQFLRDSKFKVVSSNNGVTSATELQSVFTTAKLYSRMGCEVIALNLVRNWKFKKDEVPEKADEDVQENQKPDADSLAAFRDFKSKPAPIPASEGPSMLEGFDMGGGGKGAPSMLDGFHEPKKESKTNASHPPSMLDSFQEPPSMLSGYEEPKKEKTSSEPPSMLDSFHDSPKTEDKPKSGTEKNGVNAAKKEEEDKPKADKPEDNTGNGDKTKKERNGKKPAPPSQFQEPDMSAFSFGF
ncbi:YALIA101S04e07778g1_1 [Yarrowia lipolytica]|nr:Regulator of V-ATPase in vacuolar membrane protein 1 [Yarrowia lipolytica]SEI33999.1 YALIA101S04e07778g1_1 [Yarrowia lipolytica]